MTCKEQVAVAALALGVLDATEGARLEAHVRHCADCAAALADFANLPDLLDLVPGDETTPAVPGPSEDAYGRLRAAASAKRHPRRRRLAIVAAAVVLVAGVGALVVREGSAPTAAVTASAGDVRASVSFERSPVGTRITLSLRGVHPEETCRLVAIARDGRRETASTWTADYDGTATIRGTIALAMQDIDRLVVETVAGQTLVTLSAPAPS